VLALLIRPPICLGPPLFPPSVVFFFFFFFVFLASSIICLTLQACPSSKQIFFLDHFYFLRFPSSIPGSWSRSLFQIVKSFHVREPLCLLFPFGRKTFFSQRSFAFRPAKLTQKSSPGAIRGLSSVFVLISLVGFFLHLWVTYCSGSQDLQHPSPECARGPQDFYLINFHWISFDLYFVRMSLFPSRLRSGDFFGSALDLRASKFRFSLFFFSLLDGSLLRPGVSIWVGVFL